MYIFVYNCVYMYAYVVFHIIYESSTCIYAHTSTLTDAMTLLCRQGLAMAALAGKTFMEVA